MYLPMDWISRIHRKSSTFSRKQYKDKHKYSTQKIHYVEYACIDNNLYEEYIHYTASTNIKRQTAHLKEKKVTG